MRQMVGLVILTEIPGMGFVAMLRERGHFNFETMKPESWPGLCQVSVHGGVEEEEQPGNTLLRELHEELGGEFAFAVAGLIVKDARCFSSVSTHQSEDKLVTYYAIKVDCSVLRLIRLNPESGAIRFISLDQTSSIVDAIEAGFKRETGVADRTIIAMFPDAKAAVASAFALGAMSSQ